MFPESRLWDYACAQYERTEIRNACLGLQDCCDLNVNLLLCCAWAAHERLAPFDQTTIINLQREIHDWHSSQTKPLRELRKRLKTFMKQMPDLSLREMYDSALALELNMEHVELDCLEQRLAHRNKCELSETELLLGNLAAYFDAQALRFNETRRENASNFVRAVLSQGKDGALSAKSDQQVENWLLSRV